MATTEAEVQGKPTMRPISIDEIPARTNPGKAAPFVDEFLSSGAQAAAVENAKKGFKTTLSRYLTKGAGKDAPAEVRTVNGQLYIVRTG